MPSLYERFRQRKLVQWTVAYAAVAAGMVQGLSAISEPWGISAQVVRMLQVVTLLGLPITMVLAWYHGERGRQRVTAPELLLLVLILGTGAGFLAVTSPESTVRAQDTPASGDVTLTLRLAILPPEFGGPLVGDTTGLAYLLQDLLASELIGRRGLAVPDPLSLNSRLRDGDSTYAQLREQKVDYAVRIAVTRARNGFDVTCLLTDVTTESVVGRSRFRNRDQDDLPAQLSRVAQELASELQQAHDLPRSLDLEPWVEHAPRRVAAMRAFLQGTAYAYRNIPGGGAHFQRALSIEPSFIAPRVWLVSGLLRAGDTAAAARHVRVLHSLAAAASPFEQAMIGWADASVQRDAEARARHLTMALEYSPDNNVLLLNLAATLQDLGRLEEAYAVTRTAVTSRWEFPALYPRWGVLSIETGNLEGLRQTLEDALQFRPVRPYTFALLEALAMYEGDTVATARYGRAVTEAVKSGQAPTMLQEMAPYYAKLSDIAASRGDEPARHRLLARLQAVQ